jgi:hypothetical protein
MGGRSRELTVKKGAKRNRLHALAPRSVGSYKDAVSSRVRCGPEVFETPQDKASFFKIVAFKPGDRVWALYRTG